MEQVKPPSKDHKSHTNAPEDRFYAVYILFFALGLMHFLPWTFFTTATKFWMYKFRNTTINETSSELRTDLQVDFSAALTTTLNITEVSFLIIGILFGPLVRPQVRLVGALSVIFTLFILLTAFVKIDTDSWQGGFFALIMAVVAGINSMNAVFGITIFSVLSCFPQHYLAPYLTGSGLSSIFSSTLQILTLASGLSVQNSALLYFSIGLFTIGLSLAMLISTNNNNFYLYHTTNHFKSAQNKRVGFKKALRLAKILWTQLLMVGFYIFVYEGNVIALVVSEGEGRSVWNDVYFIPTITYLLSAVCDLIGRSIGFRWAPNIKPYVWTIFSAVRTLIFFPLFMFCNAQRRHHLPVLLPHDYQYIISIIFYSISGGYLNSRSIYNIAQLVPEEDLKNAYHVRLLCLGLQMGIFSFVGIVTVQLL